jgi:tetratricopeptide (TPR) repeat protein
MADDEVPGAWTIDPSTRTQLRLDRVRVMLDEGDYAGAIIEVEELLDEDPEHAEGLFLLAEALLELGEAQSAAETYEGYLATVGDGAADDLALAQKAAALCGLAVARFECCEPIGAAEAARASIRIAPELAEAHFYLSLALERVDGRKAEAASELMAAHQLDAEAYPLPLALSADGWSAAIREAMSHLPRSLIEFWRGVPIEVLDLPALEELRRSDPPVTPTVSGLYVGTPPEGGDVDPWTERPKGLRLYKANLARLGTRAAVVEEITDVLHTEAADWIGVGSDEVADEGPER